MKYRIDIQGIHCSGCKNLITLSLDEVGLDSIEVDEQTNTAEFASDKEQAEVQQLLKLAFTELQAQNYSYSNLTLAE